MELVAMLSDTLLRGIIRPDDRTMVLILYREGASDRDMAAKLSRSRRYITALRRSMGLPDRRGRHRDAAREEAERKMCLSCKKPECDNCLAAGIKRS